MTYAEFAKMQIDLGALGAVGGRNAVRYICTPKGENIFGWAGVDGIHFCTVKGCGETVFSVSPMNMGQNCVQPTGYGRLFAAAACLRRYRRVGAGVDVDGRTV